MARDPDDPLPPEAELALAWSGPARREPLRTALCLDRRLARIVARTGEPMLGQMRLAWWRDMLGTPVGERPRGDAVLDAIGEHWQRQEAALVAMVDAWEVLVTADVLDAARAADFGKGRGAFFAALSSDPLPGARLAIAGRRWALADAAAGVSDPQERAVLVEAGLSHGGQGKGALPSTLRGLAVLEALAVRALRRGGRPLMEGRGASWAALRAGIFRA